MTDIAPATPEVISFQRGVARMEESGYREVDFVPKWNEWIDRGDVVLIFENQDLSSSSVGHVATMPWTEGEKTAGGDGPLPWNAPDNTALGLGWRYRTAYIIREKS